jgi:3-oxoacyl-[acyl-carrier protein] reductase
MRFKGKTVLVTGGSRGIGRAIALAFAGEGASVAIVYAHNEEAAGQTIAMLHERGVDCRKFRCDVRQWDAVAKTVEEIADGLGEIDVLVNCAGVVKDSLLLSMEPEDWRVVIDTNLGGAFHFMKAVGTAMVVRKKGAIINISSLAGERGGRGQVNYAASKGGLNALTRAAAIEFAPKGVTVNAVAPGLVLTEMSSAVRSLVGDSLKKSIPLRRFAEPGDIPGVVLFLASPAAAYITGQVIYVDGGLGATVKY